MNLDAWRSTLEEQLTRPVVGARLSRRWALLLVAGVALAIRPGVTWSDELAGGLAAVEAELMQAIAAAERSVVSIARRPRTPAGLDNRRFDRPRAGEELEAASLPVEFGAGVIIAGNTNEERLVLTAAHVAFGQRTFSGAAGAAAGDDTVISVTLASRHVVTAELVAADQRSDLAVLRLPLADAGIPLDAAPPIEFGDGAPLQKGRLVIALGNPYAIARDGSASASIGIVSNVSRKPWPPRGVLIDPTEEDLTIHHYGTLLQVDTRLNLGTSGGALLNRQGQLVGLTTALAALEGYEKSVGYAVPMDRPAQSIIAALRQGYEVEYGFLGIQPGEATPELMAQFVDLTLQAAAARVRRVAPLSPADRGGLRTNDIVLSVGETPVYSDVDLVREIGWLGPDAIAKLTVLRPEAREVFPLECRLGKWPVYDESLSVATRERHPAWRGLHIDYATARKRYLPPNPLVAFPQGVVVTRVDPGSPAATAGLTEGEFVVRLAGLEVLSPAEFTAAVANQAGAVTLQMADGRSVPIPAVDGE